MRILRRFTAGLKSPYDGLAFEARRSEIREPDGRVVFSQTDVTVPAGWSQVATDILAQKYFRRTGVKRADGTVGGERDAREVFHRMAGCWADWGKRAGYFTTEEDGAAFYDEMRFMLARQWAAPNSPQWFNTGLHFAYGIGGPAQGHYFVDEKTDEVKESTSAYARPQPSACFIQSIKDDLVSPGGIMDLWVREARLFKYGSGSGTNYSNLRADGEPLSGGGRSSGLMSFLKVGDRAAGVIKSGGTTRRAAKMVCLDLDHPEIEDFINWKVREEQKVSALVAGAAIHREKLDEILAAAASGGTDPEKNPRLNDALVDARESHIPDGYLAKTLRLAEEGKREIDFPLLDVDWQGEAYLTVSGQNSNNSVRVPNAFFEKVARDESWELRYRTDGKVAKALPARKLWDAIGYAAWASADPGVHCETTIDEWHTCPAGGRIRASNPCSEYLFLDDSACNLASLNLVKFYDERTGKLDLPALAHACRLWTIALEISVLMAQYPAPEIARNSHEYRTLGLGYANLGALLMSMGIPYGSSRATALAGAITAVVTGEAYAASAEMAGERGAFARFGENRDAMLRVIRNHRRAAFGEKEYEGLSTPPVAIDERHCPPDLLAAAREAWDRALSVGEKHGYRNAQVSVIAPTGTIGLLLDCDTTGIEPDFALVKFKKLAGGGYFRIINGSVPRALRSLGYAPAEIDAIVKYCSGHGTLAGAPHVNPESLRARGVEEDELQRIERRLPTAFDLHFVVDAGSLGFTSAQIEEANKFACGTLTVEGAPFLKDEHLPVFDCANRCGVYGRRFLDYRAHVDMLVAAQSFISGAISKTINVPSDASVQAIKDVYLDAWKKGAKAISIYRDGSKLSQPLSATLHRPTASGVRINRPAGGGPSPTVRHELPNRRFGYTVKATIGGQSVHLRTGEYDDGTIGEIFIDVYKEGAAYRSLMNAFAISVSLGLQYGVPLDEFVRKFHLFRFEPNGYVADHDSIRFCSSIIDFIFRDLALNYLGRTDLVHVPPALDQGGASLTPAEKTVQLEASASVARTRGYEGDPCPECGQFTMVRGGTCLRCESCGATSGCG